MPHSIFILDDNQEILELTRYSLEHLDVKVHAFSSPSQALKKIDTHGVPDIVITDLKMGNMNGIEFLMRLTMHHSSVKAIIFTGHPETLPPGCNYRTIFKDAHGFDKLVSEVESMLRVLQPAA